MESKGDVYLLDICKDLLTNVPDVLLRAMCYCFLYIMGTSCRNMRRVTSDEVPAMSEEIVHRVTLECESECL
jgi:hypothetical protein